MSGISSRIGTFGIAKQTAKGAAAAAPTQKLEFAGQPSLAPVKERARFATTDSGRDPGDGYTTRLGVEGEVPLYGHFDALALLCYLALGSNADSGVGPDYTHTGTPADDLPWFTCWRQVGNQIFEKFVDCKLSRLALESSAGAPLMATLGIVGISAAFEASEPVLAALAQSSALLHPEASGLIKLDTVSQPVDRFSFEVNNNISAWQADGYTAQDIDPGAREIALALGVRFTGATAFPKYREFFYGSDAGTALSPVVGTHAFEIEFLKAANKSLKIALPQVTYAGVPVQPDPAGDPIHIDLSCQVEKPAGAAICTTTVKDQAATV